jgi:hypothetical protein
MYDIQTVMKAQFQVKYWETRFMFLEDTEIRALLREHKINAVEIFGLKYAGFIQ